MDVVEQYVKLSGAISELEVQASALRQDFLRPGARLRSTQYEVVVSRQMERVFKAELLPPEILNDPRFWEVAAREAVDVRPLDGTHSFLRPETAVDVDRLRYRC